MKLKTQLIKTVSSLLVIGALVVPPVTADTFTYTRKGGGIFDAWYDSSVSSYGYTPHLDFSRNAWGGISSKVSIGFTTNHRGYSTDEIYVGNSATTNLFGLMVPYKVSWPTNTLATDQKGNAPTSNWDYSVISIYDNSLSAHKLKTWTGITHTTTHELGHSLGLAHTTTHGQIGPSVMSAGSVADRNVNTPNAYDKAQLKLKWGS
ncbi:hypothetical protein [Paenibacillus pinihumi]|uniref:hypothetical protein n=1 Tax=Paenibacillus pinihumi TaxID=669462 RepID=UPI00048B8581|nr:hypothetical protein [Paenibacillus pinihumi]